MYLVRPDGYVGLSVDDYSAATGWPHIANGGSPPRARLGFSTDPAPLSETPLLDARLARQTGCSTDQCSTIGTGKILADLQPSVVAKRSHEATGPARARRGVSCQAGQPTLRVLYTKSGTRLSAATIGADDALVDHKAYWALARSSGEAGYLTAVINSAAVLAKVTDLQPHGQRDKRDFDNLVWTLPIPEYDDTDPLHRDLAAAAAHAESVAAAVQFTDTQHFTAKRRAIRAALVADGVAAEIEALVDALLPP